MKHKRDKLKFVRLDSLEQIFKKFKISKNLNALIDFGQIQYQKFSIDILYLCAVLGA